MSGENLSARGRANRRKGASWEREVARLLRLIWPDAKRGLQTRGGTKEVPDVEGTPFYLELKRGVRCNIKAALEQAASSSDGRPPVAVTKEDAKRPIVSMYIEDWFNLLAAVYGVRDDSIL